MVESKELIVPKTLKEIIFNCTKRKCSFIDLDDFQKKQVVLFIKTNSIDCKVFGIKGFDVLKQVFFTEEYRPSEKSYKCEIVEFSSFKEYYDYLNGDIYSNACYFGYSFTKEDLVFIGQNRRRINKVSYKRDRIDNYTFERIEEKSIKDNIDRANHYREMKDWLDSCPPITTYKALIEQLSVFKKQYHGFYDLKIFLIYVIMKNGKQVENAIIYFASLCYKDYDLSFDDVLFMFGADAARSFICAYYDSTYSLKTNKIRKRNFKRKLELLSDKTGLIERSESEFCLSTQLYQVKKYFYKNSVVISYTWYFLSFEQMASFLDGDLSNCDLSQARSLEVDFSKYKTNENTLLPERNKYSSYAVYKGYDNYTNKFYVIQGWFDSKGNVVNQDPHYFDYFCDFYYFLHGDISSSDLMMCDSVENIKKIPGINYQEVKARSTAAEELGLKIERIPAEYMETKSFPLPEKHELATVNTFLEKRFETVEYSRSIKEVSYISDIHLMHRFMANHCKTSIDAMYVMLKLIENTYKQSTQINLVGGDVSSNLDVYDYFVRNLSRKFKGDTFFVLGNHELWDFDEGDLNTIVSEYEDILSNDGQHLVHNNIFYFSPEGIKEITELELKSISIDDLRQAVRDAFLIIFGGIGFAGKNETFNANNGIYRKAINRQQEIKLSEEFDLLYDKVVGALYDKNVIVFTHMPFEDWSKSSERVNGFVYVSGHNHRNYFFDDGNVRVYADNQIGYQQKEISLKRFSMDYAYDWFSDYKDGIYKIDRNDYEKFYKGINVPMSFIKWEYQDLYMLKREGVYMFLLTTKKGVLMTLSGGAVKGAGNHTVEYFYEHLSNYSKSIKLFLSKYDVYQKNIANEVKRIGGSGEIHGCIIDIDFYDHLYVNPLDGSIVPYFARTMVDKYVYENIPSLLKNECPELYENYRKMPDGDKNELVKIDSNALISSKKTFVSNTEMYDISRIIKGLQYTLKYNVVRLWNDFIINDVSEENGRLIVNNIIHPEEIE